MKTNIGDNQSPKQDNDGRAEASPIESPKISSDWHLRDDLKFHPLAAMFPVQNGDAINILGLNIKAQGLQQPIAMHKGEILDGRSRWEACQRLGIKLKPSDFVEFMGTNPLEFVISQNVTRRHLNDGQRAILGITFLPLFEAQAKERRGKRTDLGGGEVDGAGGRATSKVAELFNVSSRLVQTAKRICNGKVAEITKAVLDGILPITKAETLVARPVEQQKKALAAELKRLNDEPRKPNKKKSAKSKDVNAQPAEVHSGAAKKEKMVSAAVGDGVANTPPSTDEINETKLPQPENSAAMVLVQNPDVSSGAIASLPEGKLVITSLTQIGSVEKLLRKITAEYETWQVAIKMTILPSSVASKTSP